MPEVRHREGQRHLEPNAWSKHLSSHLLLGGEGGCSPAQVRGKGKGAGWE